MIYVGVDPGLHGAVGILAADGSLLAVHDTPTIALTRSQGQRREFNLVALAQIVAPYAGQPVHVMLEESQPMPGQGVRSMFTTGQGHGVWLGMLGALGLAHTRVRPATWKRALHLTADKEACRHRAMQLFPTADLHLKKHHGRAEALLLAHFAWLTVRPGARHALGGMVGAGPVSGMS
jgi:hypothetical protein